MEAITIAARQREWLIRQGTTHGFRVSEDGFDVVSSEWRRFRKGNEQGREVILLQAAFEDVLTVTDAEAFIQADTHKGRWLRQGLRDGEDDGDAP